MTSPPAMLLPVVDDARARLTETSSDPWRCQKSKCPPKGHKVLRFPASWQDNGSYRSSRATACKVFIVSAAPTLLRHCRYTLGRKRLFRAVAALFGQLEI
jgi:hypothetical protein